MGGYALWGEGGGALRALARLPLVLFLILGFTRWRLHYPRALAETREVTMTEAERIGL